jgi:hypothetical protein
MPQFVAKLARVGPLWCRNGPRSCRLGAKPVAEENPSSDVQGGCQPGPICSLVQRTAALFASAPRPNRLGGLCPAHVDSDFSCKVA